MARLDFHNFLPLVPPSPQRGSPLEQRGGGWQLWGGSKLPAEGPLEQRGGAGNFGGGQSCREILPGARLSQMGSRRGPWEQNQTLCQAIVLKLPKVKLPRTLFIFFILEATEAPPTPANACTSALLLLPISLLLSLLLSLSLSLSLSLCLCLSFPVAVYGYAYVGANADVFVDDSPHADADPDA